MGELPKGSGHIYEHMIDADNHPITFVSPDEAAAFCRKLWDQPEFGGKIIVRLPTLDEWLFARDCGRKTVADGHPALCRWDRAGNPAIDLTKVNLPSNELWNLRLLLTAPGHEDGAALHSAIGQNPPNRWLLYDMIGNVREWVTVPGSQDFAAVGGSFRERDFEEVDRIEQRPWEDVGFRIVVVPAPE
jgi:formylglycine-generating enzyme required for sulfatase activity